jgi:hypothetical protein
MVEENADVARDDSTQRQLRSIVQSKRFFIQSWLQECVERVTDSDRAGDSIVTCLYLCLSSLLHEMLLSSLPHISRHLSTIFFQQPTKNALMRTIYPEFWAAVSSSVQRNRFAIVAVRNTTHVINFHMVIITTTLQIRAICRKTSRLKAIQLLHHSSIVLASNIEFV